MGFPLPDHRIKLRKETQHAQAAPTGHTPAWADAHRAKVTSGSGRPLRSARFHLDSSQARLACEAGVSFGTIYVAESERLSTDSPAAEADGGGH